ncbi:hypothetical protein [Undibacterium pigrum]|uniref:Yip1 domain-containing protein n=1 Tax=Undibacterium pigrum TaxID=401470 RepID=A0A318JD13_9BURK|nr:hypothetical protein [Undibacterium pigrum]PXX44944.1 hypothetical protein DFR42_102156 [Undibacterium pigrum]
MIDYFSNAIKNEHIVTWGQAVRALLISIPVFVLFLIVSTVVVAGVVVLAGFAGQGGHGTNPGNTEFFNSAFSYVKIFGLITFLSSLAVIRAICLCIAAMCQASYGKTNIVFFICTGVLAAVLLMMMVYFTYLRPSP